MCLAIAAVIGSREADVIHGDETVVQVLKEPGRAAQTQSYLWARTTDSGPPIRLFSDTPGRGRSQAQPLYEGIKRGSVFVAAEAALPKQARGHEPLATRFITAMGQLYAIESQTKDANPEQHLPLSQTHSRAILANIETRLLQHLHEVMPNSLLGKALHCLSAQWPKLIRFVENGHWPWHDGFASSSIYQILNKQLC